MEVCAISGQIGTNGTKGEAGIAGLIGEQGQLGDLGEKGALGQTGPIGPDGEKGLRVRTCFCWICSCHVGKQDGLAQCLTRLPVDQKVHGSIPGSNTLCSCYSGDSNSYIQA